MNDRPLRAVWAASRAAIRRRKLQTIIIWLVVMLSTVTVAIGLGLIGASTAPFDNAFGTAKGSDLTVAYDAGKVTADQVRAAEPTATSKAGPFPTTSLVGGVLSGSGPGLRGNVFVAGRADPGGPVDRLTLVTGRWVRAPGEIVLQAGFSIRAKPGETITVPGFARLTVVGIATSVTSTADGWVLPQEISARHPSGLQMLYRLPGGDPKKALAAIRSGLPSGAVVGGESYLTVKEEFSRQFNEYIPFITIFGALALVVSILIIVNAISGAVLSGFRHIGIMKSLGFGPAQVALVYFIMIAIPSAVGCGIGLVIGDLAANALTTLVAHDFRLPAGSSIGLETNAVAVLLVLGMVVLSMLVPVVRAARLPAVKAIRGQAESRSGRGLRIQRSLARTGLPRWAGLGLSLPFGRPGRTALTFAVVFLGAVSMVFGAGLYRTVDGISSAGIESHVQIRVFKMYPSLTGDRVVERVLETERGVAEVVTDGDVTVNGPGGVGDLDVEGYRGDITHVLSAEMLTGRLFRGPGEAVAPEGFLRNAGMKVGDSLDLALNGHHATVRIVGAAASPEPSRIQVDWSTLQALTPHPLATNGYWLTTGPHTDSAAVAADLQNKLRRYQAEATTVNGVRPLAVVMDGLMLIFTMIICAAVGLGILYTVVLMTRERTRDIGVLKALGMTPREVRRMMITSMAAIGLLAGILAIPVGVFAHHGAAVYTGNLIQSGMESSWIHVYTLPLTLGLALAGILLAVLASLLPAGWASRIRTATALRSE